MKRLLSVLICVGLMGIGFSPLAHADGLWYETGPGADMIDSMGLGDYAEYITGITQFDVMGNIVMQLMAGQQSQILYFSDGRIVDGSLFTNDDGWQAGAIKYDYHGVNLIAVEYKQDDGVLITVFADPTHHTDGLMPTLTFKVENNDGHFIGKDGLASIFEDLTIYGEKGDASQKIAGVGDVALVGIQFSAAWIAHHGGSASELEAAVKAELAAFGNPEFGSMGGKNVFEAMFDAINAGETALALNSAALTLNLYHGMITSFDTPTVSMDLELPEDIEAQSYSEGVMKNFESKYPDAYKDLVDLNGDGEVTKKEKDSFKENVLRKIYTKILNKGGATDVIENETILNINFTYTYEDEDGEEQEVDIKVEAKLVPVTNADDEVIGAHVALNGDHVEDTVGEAEDGFYHVYYLNQEMIEAIDNRSEDIEWGEPGTAPEASGEDTSATGDESAVVAASNAYVDDYWSDAAEDADL